MSNKEQDNISETTALDSLAPNSRPADPMQMSKSGMMASLLSVMGGMSKNDMIDFFNKSMDQFGPGKTPEMIPDNFTSQNLQSIAPKGSAVAEDVNEMFEGQELTEDFKTKVATLIESAVNSRVILALTQLEEEQEQQFNTLVEEYKTELSEQVDEYLNYVVEQWVSENKLQMESAIKIELHDSFMNGLLNLFKEHYVDLPEEKFDVLAALQNEVDALKQQVNEEKNKNISLVAANEELECSKIFNELSEGLTVLDADKFSTLAEGLTYTDLSNYKEKLITIKESYFTNKNVSSNPTNDGEPVGITSLNEETETKDEGFIDPEVKRALNYMSKTARR